MQDEGDVVVAHSSLEHLRVDDQLEFCLLLFVPRRAPFDLLIELYADAFSSWTTVLRSIQSGWSDGLRTPCLCARRLHVLVSWPGLCS